MKHIKTAFFFLIMIGVHPHTLSLSNAISYQLNPGRLGDHLLAVVKAAAVSYDSGHPLDCPPFEWSDHLALSKNETYKSPKGNKPVLLNTYKSGMTHHVKNTTFFCTLKTVVNDIENFGQLYDYTRSHLGFKKRLQKLFAPLHPIEKLDLPAHTITVAVHVRTGGGFDKPLFTNNNTPYKKKGGYSDQIHPQRFPPESYYIEQIETISQLVNRQPLFVHIFTDDRDPAAITRRFQQQLAHIPNLTFSCRAVGNAHYRNVIDDLFNMMRFDCLIRPASSYSKIAQLLGDHRIIIYPKQVSWINGKLVADKVGIIDHR